MKNDLQVFKEFVDGLDDSETVTVSVGNLNWLIGYCNESSRIEDIQELKSQLIEWSAKYGEAQKEIRRLKHESIQYLGELINKTKNERLIDRYNQRMDELMK